MTPSHHLVLTESEVYAVVNALTFYDQSHSGLLDSDSIEQFRLAHSGDAADLNIDDLATKVAIA